VGVDGCCYRQGDKRARHEIKGFSASVPFGKLPRARCLCEPKREAGRNARRKMPLLFYLPMIIWLGMVEAARDERVPVKSKVQK
jgi:hypothetical protein